jgi:hypothetical protein
VDFRVALREREGILVKGEWTWTSGNAVEGLVIGILAYEGRFDDAVTMNACLPACILSLASGCGIFEGLIGS